MSSWLLKGKTSVPFPKWARLFIAVTGFTLLAYSINTFFSSDMHKLQYTFPYTVIALGCIFVAGFEKRTFLTEEGIIKEFRTWGSKGRDLIPWEEVTAVRISKSAENNVATFVRDNKNVTITIEKNENRELMDILSSYLPDISPEQID